MSAVRAAIFLRSASPGAVFRYLERMRLTGDESVDLLLSEPTPQTGWRILAVESHDIPSLASLGGPLSTAFTPMVLLLAEEQDQWSYKIWEKGELKDERTNARPSLTTAERLLSKLPGIPPSPPPYRSWFADHKLPLNRFLALRRSKTPIVEYRTVATLDQRSLLIENAPRFYRFRF